MPFVGIGVGVGRQRFEWQLITQQWQTITTTWN
jgi:hypothetical protein